MNGVAAAAIALGVVGVPLVVTLRIGLRCLPTWIVRNKLTHDGAVYTVKVKGFFINGQTWNPAGTGPDWKVFGPATAVYRREDTPDGPVAHLELTPTDFGPVRHYTGPIPDYAMPAYKPSQKARRQKRLANSFLLLIPLFGAAGSGTAWILSAGKSQEFRTNVAVGGFVVGIVLLWLVLLVALVANAIRKTIRRSDTRRDGDAL